MSGKPSIESNESSTQEAVLVFAICIAVIAVFADTVAGESKVDFTAFTVITVGLHCIHCDCSCSHCEGQK